MVTTLTHIGPAVFNGGLSTFCAFALLAFSKSQTFLAFFKVSFSFSLLFIKPGSDHCLALPCSLTN